MSLIQLLSMSINWLFRQDNQHSHTMESATKTTTNIPRLKFDDLPLNKADPKCSAWGLWGKDDELGTLNLIDENVTRAAASEVKLGKAINLK